jgi:hypothetical protein
VLACDPLSFNLICKLKYIQNFIYFILGDMGTFSLSGNNTTSCGKLQWLWENQVAGVSSLQKFSQVMIEKSRHFQDHVQIQPTLEKKSCSTSPQPPTSTSLLHTSPLDDALIHDTIINTATFSFQDIPCRQRPCPCRGQVISTCHLVFTNSF